MRFSFFIMLRLCYCKNSITIRTLLQYAPQTLTGNLWENVSLLYNSPLA